ncbi:MAG: hydrolase [Sedimentisphaerales bacterium]
MLDEKDCCLVVIDVQGKLAELMHDRENLFKNLCILIQAFRILEIPVLWCQQVPAALGPTVPEIAELLVGLEPINKSSFSCCGCEEFNDKLYELNKKRFDNAHRRQIMLCGIEAHVCVYQTAVDLLERDYEVEAISDAVSSRTLANKDIGLDKIAAEGAQITSVETCLFEILKTAEHPHFRQIAKLIR